MTEFTSFELAQPLTQDARNELGLTVKNFDVACSNDNERVCSGKFNMVCNAIDGLTVGDVEDGTAEEVRSSICMRLTGYDAVATTTPCTIEGSCDVRETVRESDALQFVLKSTKAVHSSYFSIRKKIKG